MAKIRPLTFSLCLAGVLALPIAAQADDYRSELTGFFERALFDGDVSPDDADLFGAQYQWYFKPVKTDGLPLAEAAFLNRSSFVAAAITFAEFGDEDFDALSAQVDYYLPNTMFFGRLNVAHTDDDFADDSTVVGGAIGITPMDGMLITTDFTEHGYDPNVTAKYVGKIANSHFYSASVGFVDPDEDDVSVSLDFDYFIDHTFSVGAGFATGSDAFDIRARKFFKNRFAVGGHIYTADGGDGFGVNASWRF
jgi:hypothetical protein